MAQQGSAIAADAACHQLGADWALRSRTTMPAAPSSLRAAIDEALRHLSGVVHDVQPVLVTVFGILNVKTLGQQNNTHHLRLSSPSSLRRCTSAQDAASCILVPTQHLASWYEWLTMQILSGCAARKSSCCLTCFVTPLPREINPQQKQPTNEEPLAETTCPYSTHRRSLLPD